MTTVVAKQADGIKKNGTTGDMVANAQGLLKIKPLSENGDYAKVKAAISDLKSGSLDYAEAYNVLALAKNSISKVYAETTVDILSAVKESKIVQRYPMLERQVNEIKALAKVRLEKAERTMPSNWLTAGIMGNSAVVEQSMKIIKLADSLAIDAYIGYTSTYGC